MMIVNPARRLAGRVFLWFWLTTLVTAGSAFWLSRAWNDSIALTTPTQTQMKALNDTRRLLDRASQRGQSLSRSLRKISRIMPYHLVVLDENGDIIAPDEPGFFRPEFRQQLNNIQHQQAAIALQQRGRILFGPGRFEFQNNEYALFLTDRTRPPEPFEMVSWWIGTGILVSILLSWLFARSLVKPIHRIQHASQRLAAGELEARVSLTGDRKDELAELAQNFNRMAAQLQTMWQSQQRLLADISHELRSPLTRMQMALGLASQQPLDTRTLARIEKEANSMEALINQLLTLTRAEAQPARLEQHVLPELLETVLKDADFEATQARKTMAVSDVPKITVIADGPLISAATENVLRNAIRYATSHITVTVVAENSYWCFQVDDDGPGLDAQACEAIFEPFYRVGSARDRESGGAGLGLAIAKAAVTTHDGTISAQPSKAGGLSVILKVPTTQHHDTDNTNR